MDFVNNVLSQFHGLIFGIGSRLALSHILLTILIAYVIWRYRGHPQTFLTWLIPSSIYKHKSNWVDLKIFLTNIWLQAVGFFALITFTPFITHLFLGGFESAFGSGSAPETYGWMRMLGATVIMIVTLDFCKYWTHYFHHENATLWPFHAVHHSAEVLTPLTVSRVHPFYRVGQSLIIGVLAGFVQAVMLYVFIGKIDLLTIGSANAGYLLFNALGANLRHSHIWLSYGPFWERIFISPAQHQIHHSSAKKHFNKNYGEVFALWDWMFGTLYIPKEQEILEFGIADGDGNRIEQPHPTLRDAMIEPFVTSWRSLIKTTPKSDTPQHPAE